MKILVFDTETTGLPKSWKAPVTDVNNWPRMVQVAWVQANTETGAKLTCNYIIQPEGYTIPTAAAKIHGITTEQATAEGVSLGKVLDVFSKRIAEADIMVAHNYSFDKAIVGAEFIRTGREQHCTVLLKKKSVCTMLATIKFVGARNKRGGNKFPTNMELYKKLFGKEFEGAHDAKADVEATDRSFWECCRVGLLNDKIKTGTA